MLCFDLAGGEAHSYQYKARRAMYACKGSSAFRYVTMLEFVSEGPIALHREYVYGYVCKHSKLEGNDDRQETSQSAAGVHRPCSELTHTLCLDRTRRRQPLRPRRC